MSDTRPTLRSAAWTMTGFLDAATHLLQTDRASSELRLYFYAVTGAGWRELSAAADTWKRAIGGRSITAYVGTDHALTDPAALTVMRDGGVAIRLLRRYNGVYHPKVVWFVEAGAGHLLVGSNNLTLDGLKSNIEFATLTRLGGPDTSLDAWHSAVHAGSDPIDDDLLKAYGKEREAFGEARAKAKVAGTFTWSKRASAGGPPVAAAPARGVGAAPAAAPRAPAARPLAPAPAAAAGAPGLGIGIGASTRGDLVLEIMPRETGTGGSQVQAPMRAARSFFGLGVGRHAQVAVSLRNVLTGEDRPLTMTRFSNSTARLVIRELDYRDRPCVVQFRRTGPGTFDFEIVRESIDPTRYRELIRRCGAPTRSGSRRWIQIP